MSYVTTDTVWPSLSLSIQTRYLIATFYEIADKKDDDAGDRIANEIFAENGVLVAPNGTFKGSKEISKSREGAWKTVHSRTHRITKVFANDEAGSDLVLLGTVKMVSNDRTEKIMPFMAHITIDTSNTGPSASRMSYMEIFISPSK
ncbi:hypothetical protein B0J11DRAFT_612041 [Dendryphion nanum]|uniref:SnoaL-like domain-containing protein n=1 Tax=Dendryphion nanum TaxID=256645 RepID=A0A9P9E783_9PLEO|nr:hypothetical protein B0J11DRAFT_612041 [Dendryphion nanum]